MTASLLVTGATGFVGRGLLVRLGESSDRQVRACVRTPSAELPPGVERVLVPDIAAPNIDWSGFLRGVDTIIHLAARAHVMRDIALDPLAEFRRVNVAGTVALARQAARSRVRRFIFISSIKVNGEHTARERPFTPTDVPDPQDPYGTSKCEAELELQTIAADSAVELVVIRPPLVYGPGVKGNFRIMMQWLQRGTPLPLGSIDNRRSLVALGNLVDLILTCVEHPAAAQQKFLVCDGEDLSTTELLRRLGQMMGQPARLVPIPAAVLRTAARLAGKAGVAQRLCDSLQVDSSATRQRLGWRPPVSVNDGLSIAVRDFLSHSTVS